MPETCYLMTNFKIQVNPLLLLIVTWYTMLFVLPSIMIYAWFLKFGIEFSQSVMCDICC